MLIRKICRDKLPGKTLRSRAGDADHRPAVFNQSTGRSTTDAREAPVTIATLGFSFDILLHFPAA